MEEFEELPLEDEFEQLVISEGERKRMESKPTYMDIEDVRAWDSVSEYSECEGGEEQEERDREGGEYEAEKENEDEGYSLNKSSDIAELKALFSRKIDESASNTTPQNQTPTPSSSFPSSNGKKKTYADIKDSKIKKDVNMDWIPNNPMDAHLKLKYKVEDDLYDEDIDNLDAEFVKQKKANVCGVGEGKSDATLSCACCFTVLTYHSQRHLTHAHQYRSMFVENCTVLKKEKLIIPLENNNKKKGKKVEAMEEDGEIYYPVVCDSCGSEVGVHDQEEMFHLFNVIPSMY